MIVLLLAACTIPPPRTPTARPTTSPSPTPPPPAPTALLTATPEPTQEIGAIPAFTAGDLVVTATDGLRVRQRPSLTSVVLAGLLPLNAPLEIVMGPVLVGENGWYLVRDAGADEPEFGEGWIASGFEPEPFLVPTGRRVEETDSVASFAQTGDAEYGPVAIPDDRHAIRWLALDPEGRRCEFAVLLSSGPGEPVPAIRATIGTGVVPGTLQQPQFAAVGVTGQVFVTIRSDCAWTLVVTRVPDPAGEPSPPP